jgi:hypothetical protein
MLWKQARAYAHCNCPDAPSYHSNCQRGLMPILDQLQSAIDAATAEVKKEESLGSETPATMGVVSKQTGLTSLNQRERDTLCGEWMNCPMCGGHGAILMHPYYGKPMPPKEEIRCEHCEGRKRFFVVPDDCLTVRESVAVRLSPNGGNSLDSR